ncbi:MAG: CehA/McbA family metallohydrolase [Planctomycetota bacterium]|nr:CehA/McbA family metallohydrolase [Planctomycetota bacterium]
MSCDGKHRTVGWLWGIYLRGLILVGCMPLMIYGQVGVVDFQTVDSQTKQQIPARFHIWNSKGIAIKPPGMPFFHDHFVCNGKVRLRLQPGRYQFEIERGPEYRIHRGYFQMLPGAEDKKVIPLKRIVEMKAEGWWSGDLHIHRPLEDIPLLMQAEDLYVAPVITWWNKNNLWQGKTLPEHLLQQFDENRFYHVLSGEDERDGGALIYHHLRSPHNIVAAQRDQPSSMKFLLEIHQNPDVHVDIEKPFWWDVPVWIASGMVDSIGINNNHMQRSKMNNTEAWGKPRDLDRFAGPHGNGKWSQYIYFQILNSGHRIAPSAGSASGVLHSPVGYNRVYVYCGDTFSWKTWWENLRAGKVVVTNGPLLRPRVNGELPGHVFKAEAGQTVTLSSTLRLAFQEKVEYLEIIRDGLVVENVRLDAYAKMGGRLPDVEFKESGWMMIRAVTNHPKTYRLASSGPFYVEIGGKRRISAAASQFFVDWLKQRQQRIELTDPDALEEVMQYYRGAQSYWEAVQKAATAE